MLTQISLYNVLVLVLQQQQQQKEKCFKPVFDNHNDIRIGFI